MAGNVSERKEAIMSFAIPNRKGWLQKGLVTVPHPKKDIKLGTLAQIWRQAGIKH
jgi:hypothetical protein